MVAGLGNTDITSRTVDMHHPCTAKGAQAGSLRVLGRQMMIIRRSICTHVQCTHVYMYIVHSCQVKKEIKELLTQPEIQTRTVDNVDGDVLYFALKSQQRDAPISAKKVGEEKFMFSCDSAADLNSFIERMRNLEVTTRVVPCSLPLKEMLGNANLFHRSYALLYGMKLGHIVNVQDNPV
eukprot:sb/3471721/